MDASESKRLLELEIENAKLKRIVADQMLDMSSMKELLAKKTGDAHGQAQSCGFPDERDRPERTAGLPDRRLGTVDATVPAITEGRCAC
jgi:hypothetical protein